MMVSHDEVMSMGQMDLRKLYEKQIEEWNAEATHPEGSKAPVPLSDQPANTVLAFDTSDMDTIDKFFFESFVESLKASDGSYKTIMKTQLPHQVNEIPQPRSMKQLIRAKTPRISTAAAGTNGHLFSTNLWTAMSVNPYFTEAQKETICNRGAWKVNQLYDECAKLNESHPNWADFSQELTVRAGFRRGLRWIHAEEDENRVEVVDEGSVAAQSEPDWNVEAVVSEDDFK